MRARAARDLNAAVAIAARDVTRFVRSPSQIFMSLFIPVIFIGLMGGSLNQNMGRSLHYDFMQYVLLGMVTSVIYQFSMNGMVSLVEDRENDLTQEIFVAPVSRSAIILGKVAGSSVAALVGIVGTFAVALALRIPLSWSDAGRILMIAPFLALSGAALGIFFIGLVRDPQAADLGSFVLVFPQIFLTGAIIPVGHSSGVLGVIKDVLPMTYLIDLLRGVFYHGRDEYDQVVLHPPLFDLAVTLGFFAVFVIAGTFLFARRERDR
ncbi:ABC transporter permease [Actinomadura litoris]|uniref:ABC transporter permease n=1 Tax=Actinomadura litoris TaxID=2678616 RepID=UPI001FA78837|nr:ABC transporter permease [Actinomadura litoris]